MHVDRVEIGGCGDRSPVIYVLVASICGLLIGTVGVGGILLAPLLVYLAGMELHLAMATSSWSFLFTGLAGTAAYAQRGSIPWTLVGWLSLGVLPAALLGAAVNVSLPSGVLSLLLAALIAGSGLNALLRRSDGREGAADERPVALAMMGAGTGFGSALTGTGGPVLWLPLATWFRIPALAALGVGQAIQLPIAIFASVGFYLAGEIDFGLGTLLGVVQAITVIVGARIAHKVSSDRLRRMVAVTLVGAGFFMAAKSLI